jgi:hypothetical protein
MIHLERVVEFTVLLVYLAVCWMQAWGFCHSCRGLGAVCCLPLEMALGTLLGSLCPAHKWVASSICCVNVTVTIAACRLWSLTLIDFADESACGHVSTLS